MPKPAGSDLREDLAEVVALIGRHAPDLVLLDSFRSLWRGDERDEAQVSAALDPLRELAHDRDIAIGLTHHAKKGDAEEYRGSTAIGAAVEWVAMLSRVKGDENKGRRKLSTPLCRMAKEREDRWVEILSESDEGPVSLTEAEPYTAPSPRDDNADAVVDVLTEAPQSGRAIARASGLSEATVRRVLPELAEQNLARQTGSGWVRHLRHPYRSDAPDAPLEADPEDAQEWAERLFDESQRQEDR